MVSPWVKGSQESLSLECKTATTYELVARGETRTKTNIKSKVDRGPFQIDKQQDKVKVAASGQGGPVFGASKDDNKQDLGITDIGYG